ncbi:rhamnogalacturonan acetylesterase [Paenibacillus tarimensis]
MSKRPTTAIYLAGDSTVQTYKEEAAPQAGWGQFIPRYFSDKVTFINRAIGGRSSRTFVEEGRLERILDDIQPHDYLFVQMGHNDSSKNKPERYTDPYTDYKRYLKMYIEGARRRQAVPLLITPVARLHYSENGEFMNDFPEYCDAMKQVAAEEDTALIDLMDRSLQYYNAIGFDEARTFFMVSVNGTDHTHFTAKGADAVARIVSQAVKEAGLTISEEVTL